ncbi:uncharacterized protein LOC119459071 [Dermacentor silvarum]|uniref:uncharacterized protein LOC119459071 n=1 Tax=Dermacentor silvarum TaxID=543639 RepID=UPI001897ECD6|nr:uncharacterized protein LOC119459071 [Dermacentor silvarum]
MAYKCSILQAVAKALPQFLKHASAYSQMKRPKVKKCLKEIEQAKNCLKSVTPEHEGAPVLLLALFDEDEELIYKTVEETAHDDDLGDMPVTPIIFECLLVVVKPHQRGPGLFEAEMFTVCVDGVVILTTQRAAAFKVMFLLYFVLNIEYPPEVALTLEFVQRAIAGINPERSTKARRTSKKQYCLSPKVAALANALDQYKFEA